MRSHVLRGASIAAAPLALMASLTLAACSADPPPAAHPQTLMPTNNEFTSAIMHTNAMGSAQVDLTFTTDRAGDMTTRSASGPVVLGGPFGELTWTDTGVRERANGQGVYLQEPAPDGPWRALPKGETTETMPLTQVLWGLGGASIDCTADPSQKGALLCEGTMPVDGDLLNRLGLPSDEKSALTPADAAGPARVSISIDQRGRIIQVRRIVEFSAADGPLTVDTLARLSDFSRRIDIAVPPTTATP